MYSYGQRAGIFSLKPVDREKDPSFQKARQYSFLLLKFRPRSEHEIAERLTRKKFGPSVVRATVFYLREHRLVDDEQFARAWVAERLKKPFGVRRISRELQVKGIDRSVIEAVLRDATAGYDEGTQVSALAREKLSRMKALPPETARRRVFAYLLRRGFSPEQAIDALQERENG